MNKIKLFFIVLPVFLLMEVTAQVKPNILWITSEDNSVNWIGCYGNQYAETPNIDRLADEGFRYTHLFFMPMRRCVPHREAPGLPVFMPFQWGHIPCAVETISRMIV
jgi:hypothetical protein